MSPSPRTLNDPQLRHLPELLHSLGVPVRSNNHIKKTSKTVKKLHPAKPITTANVSEDPGEEGDLT